MAASVAWGDAIVSVVVSELEITVNASSDHHVVFQQVVDGAFVKMKIKQQFIGNPAIKSAAASRNTNSLQRSHLRQRVPNSITVTMGAGNDVVIFEADDDPATVRCAVNGSTFTDDPVPVTIILGAGNDGFLGKSGGGDPCPNQLVPSLSGVTGFPGFEAHFKASTAGRGTTGSSGLLLGWTP